MPTGPRSSIGQVKPTGWHTAKYDSVDGKYLYNRCHLIGYQLTAENANKKNLITGTRYLNVDGMLPFENMVADYIHETGNHVLYRITPVFDGNNLVASGVEMEAESVEDQGESISLCSATMCSRESVLTMRPGTAGQSDSKDHQKKIVFFDDGVYDKCKRAATSRMKNKRTVGKESYVLCTRRHKGVRIL